MPDFTRRTIIWQSFGFEETGDSTAEFDARGWKQRHAHRQRAESRFARYVVVRQVLLRICGSETRGRSGQILFYVCGMCFFR